MRLFSLAAILFFSSCINSFAQSDTIITKLDYKLKPATNNRSNYFSKMWKEGNLWHEKILRNGTNTILSECFYTDEARQNKEGTYVAYHTLGSKSDSGFYASGKREGLYFEWHGNSSKASLTNFLHDLPIDTSYAWNDSGIVIKQTITDSIGNGSSKEFWTNGKIKGTGKINGGKKQAEWQYLREDGSKAMLVEFAADSVSIAKCFEINGDLRTSGKCIFEKPTEFRGGPEGWRRFLEKNFRYPEYAQRKNIQGVVSVQFYVSKTGEVSDLKILTSPHEVLSREVLRLMADSPKWEPAIFLNEPVPFRHIQSITFQLQ